MIYKVFTFLYGLLVLGFMYNAVNQESTNMAFMNVVIAAYFAIRTIDMYQEGFGKKDGN